MPIRSRACTPAWISRRTTRNVITGTTDEAPAEPGAVWKKILFNPWTKRSLFAVCLIPAALLIWRGFEGHLGANPVEFIEHATGDWAIRFLLITLAVTPLRKIFNQPLLTRFRRM